MFGRGKETKGEDMIGKKPEPTMSKPVSSGGSGGGSAPSDMKAVLGKGSEFEGKLKFEGTVRIDGKFRGEIKSEGVLIIGDHATIDGDVDVESAIISGELKGNVKAKTRVELRAPGKLYGNIATPIIVIEEGVIFDGNCQMVKDGKKPAPLDDKGAGAPKP